MAKYLITGGAGFIGSNIVKELLKRGEEVRVLDNLSTGRRENIEEVLKEIEFIEGDIRSREVAKRAVRSVDYVLHQAALPSVPRSVNDPAASNEVNVSGTLNILIAARDADVKKVVYASSSSVYGDTPELPKREDMKLNPLSPYAVSKLGGEYYVRVFSNIYQLPTICLRYFNVFGPCQNPDSQYAAVIPKFIRMMLRDKNPTIFGDGNQTRDFTYVDNVVLANILAAKNIDSSGEVFNIAGGARHSLLYLAKYLKEKCQKNLPPKFLEQRSGDVKHSLADISKAKAGLGYKVKVKFELGLEKTVDFFLKRQNGNEDF
jgi:nucleoside-diphosphate-sugar epimerase